APDARHRARLEAREEADGRVAVGAPALFRARLPRPPPREPGLPLPGAAAGLWLAVDPLRRRAGNKRGDERVVCPRADLVSQLPLFGGKGARPRRDRGPRVSRRLPV